MGLVQLKRPPRGWRYEGWRACRDLTGGGVDGVPRWFRCQRCNALVTHGQVQLGGCVCGNRRLHSARELTVWEIILLKLGWFILDTRERKAIKPVWVR